MASALNIVATPGDGDAPDNSVPVTLWGAGSGGGEAATFDTVTGDWVNYGGTTIPDAELGTVIAQLTSTIVSIVSAVEDLTSRVEALENP